MSRAVAEANTNIALVKYWGKRDQKLNLPAVGSISLTLSGLSTRTEVLFDAALEHDELVLNGTAERGKTVEKVSRFLDLVRARAGTMTRARVTSANNFPTAAGLASSASAFAALSLAATKAAGLALTPPELSVLARRGSGSAARSIFGGFVEMHKGEGADGEDAFAAELPGDRRESGPAEGTGPGFDVRMVIAVASEGPKETLSTDGMRHTAETSPYFAAWVASNELDLVDARRAIAEKDLAKLGEITERSCLTMHASAMAARPAVVYFKGVTVEGHRAIGELRRAGVPAWFTCDAGPHPKALTDVASAAQVAERLAAVPGVLRTIICAPGSAARVIE
jgi:diphosphomevalonate decarboxylase